MSYAVPGVVESFFDKRINQRTLVPQLGIAIVAGLAFASDMLAVYFNLGDAWRIYGGTVLVLSMIYVFTPLIVWSLGTAVVYVLSALVKARVQPNILWRMLGWGTFPLIGAGLALAAGRYAALSSVTACDHLVCDQSKYVGLLDQVNHVYAYHAIALETTTFQVLFAVSVALLLVTSYLWTVGAYRSTTLTRAGAAITTGIPGLVLTGLYVLLIY